MSIDFSIDPFFAGCIVGMLTFSAAILLGDYIFSLTLKESWLTSGSVDRRIRERIGCLVRKIAFVFSHPFRILGRSAPCGPERKDPLIGNQAFEHADATIRAKYLDCRRRFQKAIDALNVPGATYSDCDNPNYKFGWEALDIVAPLTVEEARRIFAKFPDMLNNIRFWCEEYRKLRPKHKIPVSKLTMRRLTSVYSHHCEYAEGYPGAVVEIL